MTETMNTLNLNSKKNILNDYRYQHSRYSGNQTGQNPTKQISFNSGMSAGTRETSATLCQLKGKNAQKGFPVNKTKYCAAVNKTEYKAGTSPSNVSFGGLASNKLFKKILEKSEANGALCSAAAMLLACCVLRPVSIMTSKNVEKENRMIAATKSIASGIIGFVLMFLVSKPIEHAIKKINENPEKYLDKNAMQKLLQGNAKNTEKSRVYNVATRFFKSAADMVTAAPKGSLTIILIPPLLNVIFKKERAKKQGKELPQTNLLIQHAPNVNDVEDYAEQKHYVFFKGDKNSKNLVSSSNDVFLSPNNKYEILTMSFNFGFFSVSSSNKSIMLVTGRLFGIISFLVASIIECIDIMIESKSLFKTVLKLFSSGTDVVI